MPSSVKCSVRPVAMSVLKSIGPREIGLRRALGELPREDARLAGALVDDEPEHGGGDAALGRTGRTGHERVLAAEEAERDLREHVFALHEDATELLEECPEPLRSRANLR